MENLVDGSPFIDHDFQGNAAVYFDDKKIRQNKIEWKHPFVSIHWTAKVSFLEVFDLYFVFSETL